MKLNEIVKVTGWPVITASLCCLSPIILVLFGLGTVTFASSLTDILYGQYKWVFRVTGLIFLAISAIIYFRQQIGICTIDEAKKHRREIINTVLLFSIAGILGYVFFLYVVLHYIGVILGIWADYSY